MSKTYKCALPWLRNVLQGCFLFQNNYSSLFDMLASSFSHLPSQGVVINMSSTLLPQNSPSHFICREWACKRDSEVRRGITIHNLTNLGFPTVIWNFEWKNYTFYYFIFSKRINMALHSFLSNRSVNICITVRTS